MTPLLLIHGFTGAAASWDAVVEALGDAEVFRLELPGHGAKGAAAAASNAGFEAAVDRLAEEVAGVEARLPFHICGYSMGGRVALALLLRHPALFCGGTLIGAHAGIEDAAERARRAAADDALAARLERDGVAAFLLEWSRLPLFASQRELPAAVLAEQERVRGAASAAGLAAALRALTPGRMPSYWSVLKEIALPLRLVAGERDEKYVAAARRMAAPMASASLHIAPGVGHNVPLEAPEWTAELLRERAL